MVWLVGIISILGYGGIIVGMAFESSFFPFPPSEIVMAPAGFNTTIDGDMKMNIVMVILSGAFGSMLGASLNYAIAYKYGRRFLLKYGRYLFLNETRMNRMDAFFTKHGEITTFIGRLIPVVRWYISFPAGLARMNYLKFLFYTGIGATIWVTILAFIGRTVGNNIELVKNHLHTVMLILIPVMAALIAGYILVGRYFSGKK